MSLQTYQKNINIVIFFLYIIVLLLFGSSYTASASSKFVQADGSSITGTIYINNSYTLKVPNQSVYFYSAQKSVAEISKTTGKLTLKIPGEVSITARNRWSNRVVAQQTFTVRRRTDYLTINSKKASLITGQTKTLTVTKNPAFSTDVLYYKSSNTSVVTVNHSTGKIKGISAGSATITVYSKSSSATPLTSRHMRKVSISVTVKSSITAAKQTAVNQVTVTFESAPENLNVSDFSLKSSSGKTVKVSAVATESSSSKTAVLTLSESITDGLSYSVNYYSSSQSFTASDGVIKNFKIEPATIAINTETSVTASAYDKNGMLLDKYTYGTTYSNITFTVSSSYLTTNKTLKFSAKNQTALVRIIYYTTVNGVKTTQVDSGYVTITSYDDTAANTTYVCNITNNSSYTFPSTQTSEYNLSLPLGSYDYRAYFKLTGTTGSEISDYSIYHVESSNTSILVGSGYLSNTTKYISLYPVAKGTATLQVKDSSNAVVHTVTVTVTEALTPTTLTLSTYSVQLSNTSVNTYAVGVSVMDQNSSEMTSYTTVTKTTVNGVTSISSNYSVICIGTTASGITADIVNSDATQKYFSLDTGCITFNSSQIQPGTYYYNVIAGGLTKTITVSVLGNNVS